MTITNLPALVVYAADAENVTFGRGTLPKVTVTMRQVAEACTAAITTTDGATVLANYTVDETDLICLMNEMRRAAGLNQCDQCRQWTDTGDLCADCAREMKLDDWRAERSMGEHG